MLVAADTSIPAFGNATGDFRAWLLRHGARAEDVHTIGGKGAAPATLPDVLAAIRALRAGPDEQCLVFVTGHGVPQQGIQVPWSHDTLGRNELDRALAEGCGIRPTVVVLSGCFSGYYLDGRLGRANRIVVSAARRDRTSFGCDARSRLTFFDQCLLGALEKPSAPTWQAALEDTKACVAQREVKGKVVPSQPQITIGTAVAGMRLPES